MSRQAGAGSEKSRRDSIEVYDGGLEQETGLRESLTCNKSLFYCYAIILRFEDDDLTLSDASIASRQMPESAEPRFGLLSSRRVSRAMIRKDLPSVSDSKRSSFIRRFS